MSAPVAAPAPSPAVTSARNSVAVVFGLVGIFFSAWASRIPDVRAELALTPGSLGLLLLSMSAGAVIALPSAGLIIDRVGTARTIATGATAVAIGMVVAGLGTDTFVYAPCVALGLFAIGIGTGIWDVSMNIEGAAVERVLARTIMARFHAAFSLGTVLGAALGATAVWAGVPVLLHLSVTAVVVLAGTLYSVRSFLPRVPPAETTADAPATRSRLAAWREPRTLLIGVLVFAAAFMEGTANDWLSVAIVDGYGVPTWVGVLGFAAFLSAMTIGRVLGTNALDRYGRTRMLWITMVLAIIGSLMVVFGQSLWIAFVGAAIWGIGASLGFPVGMSAAADEPDHAPARVSVVASIGYTAFLAGPPLLGFLGDHVGILRALVLVSVLVIPALLVVPAAKAPIAPKD